MRRLIFIFFFIFVLQNYVQAIESSDRSCFRVSDISGWRALDDKNLIVWSPSKSHPYLVKLFNRCPGLKFEDTLVFKSSLWRTCSNYNDQIHTRHMPCSIKDIKEIDAEEVLELINTFKASNDKEASENENSE
tara:strand:+ start:686 stop:1084 length:399 start_codon:yes stop_codon:yes gene_type:complete